MKSALLDTSFLITLSNPDRLNHLTAKRYYVEMLGKGVVLFISTIAISEFEVRQRISDLGLNNFLAVPFNVDHAVAAASLYAAALAGRAGGYSRVSVKDDVKMLAQCELSGITHFLTDDAACVAGLEQLRKKMQGRNLPRGVCCGEPYSDLWFNDQQVGIDFSQA